MVSKRDYTNPDCFAGVFVLCDLLRPTQQSIDEATRYCADDYEQSDQQLSFRGEKVVIGCLIGMIWRKKRNLGRAF